MIALISCKNDTKGDQETTSSETEEVTQAPPKRELTDQDRNQINSLMTKLMLNPEFKTMSSMAVSAGLTEMHSSSEGPYTLFAPEGPAFNDVPQDSINHLVNPENLEELIRFYRGHLVEGEFDSVYITQALQKEGELQFTTMSGSILTVQKRGSDLIVRDEQGREARISSSDLKSFNGVIHGLDRPLGIN
jgi:uncharacterized surface protein with fasciclin (FAS1) repeats